MIADRLADFALAPVRGDTALKMMRLSLLDWAACGLAGRAEPVARIVRQMVAAEGGAGAAALLGGGRAPMRGAALVNGTVSHALDYDDTHFDHIGHPSVAVVPAALAVAEARGAGGPALLEACLVGAEGAIRFGTWLGRGHYELGFHQTGTAGAVGATLAVGRLLRLEPAQMAQALGLVATRASGLKSQFGTMGKPFNAGLAASNGVEAALLAQAGFRSNPGALDGPQGFGATHAGAGDEAAWAGLGQAWRFEAISHKFHACCHGLHATLEALGALGLTAAQAQRVEVTTHPRWRTVCHIADPRTGLEAKFSYRHVVAMALAGRATAAMERYTDADAQSPEMAALRDRVAVRFDAAVPETAARVAVTTDAGTLRAAHDLGAPLALDARADKLRDKAQALVGAGCAERLWRATQADDISALLGAIVSPDTGN